MITVDVFAYGLLATMYSSWAAAVVPIATPVPAAPVQISTATEDGVFLIMREDLVFQPPDSFLYILKQLWRASPKSSTTYVSLQIYNPENAAASATSVSPRLFLTRNGVPQPESYSPAQAFGAFAMDGRLLKQRCCGCGNGNAPVTFYWQQDASSSAIGLFTSSVGQNTSSLVLSQETTTSAVLCGLSNLQIQENPFVQSQKGLPHPIPVPGVRVTSTGAIPVQMVANFGGHQYVTSVKRLPANQYVLSVIPYRPTACKTATAFYYKGYEEYHVGLDGRITSRPSFTLQHAATGLYVVADVLDTIALNVGSESAGLNLQNETDFDQETPEFPDYRFFVRYDNLDYNFLGYNSTPANNSYLGKPIHILCPLYHRRYCMEPTTSGKLKLSPVTLKDQRPWPTLLDPPYGFAEFLQRRNISRGIPTFTFIPIGETVYT